MKHQPGEPGPVGDSGRQAEDAREPGHVEPVPPGPAHQQLQTAAQAASRRAQVCGRGVLKVHDSS